MDAIKQHFGATPVTGVAVGLIMMGILSKSATLPFHTWLPDAGVAPSPVTSLLHAAVLVKIGVYVFARLFIATMILSVSWQHNVMVIAAASALISACAALVETDLKRIIAYSTVSQIAFIFLGLASGTQIGVVGGLLYILMHGLAKGGLFLCAGIVEQKTHTKDIMKLGGLIKTMPFTAIAFLLCALSVMGIPPFGGFFSKLMVLTGAVEAKETGGPWMAAVFVFGAVLTILYLIRVFNRVFLGEAHTEPVKEGSPVMVTCVWALAVLGLIAGLYVTPSMQVARAAFEQMTGVVK
jgi:NADH:ubiquinone oxidoreductase subunit 5 (subunit L)/multisubunit Na+/H+ antiporter MnhA subunit